MMPARRIRTCDENSLRCRKGKAPTRTTPECCLSHIRTLIFEWADLAEERGVTWWMDYGTLLGAVRNQGIIPHDKDADLGVLGEQWPEILELMPTLKERGRWWSYRKPKPGQKYKSGDRLKIRLSDTNKINVDLFGWYLKDGLYVRKNYCAVDRYKGRELPAERLFPLTEIEWEGRMLPAPADPEWVCEHRYGKGWKKPLYRNNAGQRVPNLHQPEPA